MKVIANRGKMVLKLKRRLGTKIRTVIGRGDGSGRWQTFAGDTGTRDVWNRTQVKQTQLVQKEHRWVSGPRGVSWLTSW
ncbi:hypothetical protein CW304_27295 [Bacillus sp. UFRGS-B20]|nr:hypothetical protein CW304_27295 [Bacillus sp. UFRGS-B20]